MLKIRPGAKKLLPVLAVLLSAQSCIDRNNFDFENLDNVKLQPSVALPLVHGKLTMRDLLPKEENSMIDTDENNLIRIVYSDTLASRSILEYFLLEPLFIDETYPVIYTGIPGTPQAFNGTYRENLNLDFPEADFDRIQLKQGMVTITASNSARENVEVTVNFPTLTKNGEALTKKIQFTPSSQSSQTQYIDLSGYSADLSDYGTGNNIVPVDFTIDATNQNGNLLANGAVDIFLEMKNLEYSLLEGYFGQLEIDLPSDEVEFAAFDEIFGKVGKDQFGLTGATLSFDILNTNGVPMQAHIQRLEARNRDGNKLAIQTNANPVNVAAPATPGALTVTKLDVTNEDEVIKFAPSVIDYRLTGKINEGVPAGTPNFLTDKSETSVVVNANIPLWGYLKGFTLTDTLDMGIELENDQDYIKEASIKIRIENGFPLNANVKIDFTDADYKIIETLFTEGDNYLNILPGSEVNADGDLVKAKIYNDDISITAERFEKILKAAKIIIRADLSTSQLGDGTYPHVKIKADQTLSINLGVKAAANNLVIKLNEDNDE